MKFSKLFYEYVEIELTEEQQKLLTETLEKVYGDKVFHYKEEGDFLPGKSQMLFLLDYIHKLNPDTLKIFNDYRKRVEELSLDSDIKDILITLRSAKIEIEKSLLFIIKNHQGVDEAKLNTLIVKLCYSGAYSNIMYALSFFQTDNLSFFIRTIKQKLLLEIATKYQTSEWVGNEIHSANSLYNSACHLFWTAASGG